MSKSIVDEVKQEVKQKKKEENKMKNEKNKTIVVTVLVTVASIAAIAGLIYTGFSLGRAYESDRMVEIQSKVAELTPRIDQASKE